MSDAESVARAIRPYIRQTPLIASAWLTEKLGAQVWLKCENLQLTGSFKVRGGFAAACDVRGRLVTASAGNHGQGLACACKTFDRPCTIFVPKTIPKVKAEAIRRFGAELVTAPFDNYDETQEWALQRIGEGTWVSPFDHPLVMAGNGGTTALEIFEKPFDTLVVPCGGGGLAIGAGMIARRHGAKVIGVNTEASPGMFRSRRDKRVYEKMPPEPTIAEGIEGGVSENTYRLGLEYIDDVVVVREATIRSAVVQILRHERMLVEGSAAAAVAAVMEGLVPPSRTCVVLTGSNIDFERLQELLGPAVV